jgi:glycosyltransferase involved in cell wall biosynthesis
MNKKIIRITTVPLALRYLLKGQMKFMKENGFEVVMISAEGKGLEEVIEGEQCRHIVVPMTRSITPVADLKCLIQMIRIFKKEKPDIVHTHTPKAGLLGMVAAKICGVKIRIHTIAGLRFVTARGTTRKVLVAMEKLTARAANHVWPNSFSLLQTVKKYKLSSSHKLKVIASGSSNGINLERFSIQALLPDVMEHVKQQVSYDSTLKYLLFIGRIVKDKGIEELLDVFAELFEKDKDLRLVLVGSFEEALDPLNERAKQILSSHPGLIHIQWSDAVEYFIGLAGLLIHPSYREGFPNVLLQAGALKCPVICSAIEGNVDVVEHQRTGLLFEPANRDELKEKLSFALDNPQKMNEWAEALYTRVHADFDQKIVQHKLLEEYRRLIAETGP